MNFTKMEDILLNQWPHIAYLGKKRMLLDVCYTSLGHMQLKISQVKNPASANYWLYIAHAGKDTSPASMVELLTL